VTAPMPDGPAPDDLLLRHVSDEQYQLIVGMDHLSSGTEKVSVLSMLEDWHSRDCYWPRTEEQLHDSMADCYGLVLGSNGLWCDAMVPDGKGGWVLDPSVVA
jgi:hypothetical protein